MNVFKMEFLGSCINKKERKVSNLLSKFNLRIEGVHPITRMFVFSICAFFFEIEWNMKL